MLALCYTPIVHMDPLLTPNSLMDQDAIEEAKWAETYNHSKADQLVLSKDI